MDTDLVAIARRLFFGSEEEMMRFREAPEAYLRDAGLAQVTPQELHEAVVLACETPSVVDQGATVNVSTQAPTPTPAPAPAPPAPGPEVTNVTEYVTNVHEYYTTTNVDDRDTNIDNSSNIVNIGDGDVTVTNETAVAGDEGVANTGEISDAVVNTGDVGGDAVMVGSADDSVIGSENVTQVNDNTGDTAVGEGNTISDDDNVAIALGDSANAQAGDGGNENNQIGDLNFGEGSSGGLVDQGSGPQVNISQGSGDDTQTNTDDDVIAIETGAGDQIIDTTVPAADPAEDPGADPVAASAERASSLGIEEAVMPTGLDRQDMDEEEVDLS